MASVSAALFAALHAGNLLTGQSLLATAIQLVYTFAFGILMCLTLRVTGNLSWPILLHASTDPSTFLATPYPTQGPVSAVAGLGNPAVIVAALVLLIFIRGAVMGACKGGMTSCGSRLPAVSSLRERIVRWFKRERAYQPPPGRLTEDTTQRLPSGGVIQRMPGDGVDPGSFNPQTGRNP